MAVKTIKCKINDISVTVPEGTSIISAFKESNQEIAHYCWHPGLSVAGVCRLCMVDIQGIDKLQIACNTAVKDGMVVSNQTHKVKEAVRWGLEFHLINHPLDCPICDQAGECELQDQYMKFGRYRPGMAERKVKKRKVVDLGSKIVLDSERCILCSRCVRFTDEVSKTKELGIFDRGDKSEIGVFKDKPLENNYALNTVDICPVGALTSKDFRFRQRVWYLKTAETICTGCSTGCNTYVDYNEEGLFRVRPKKNDKINSWWMCDKGRELYQLTNTKGRLKTALLPHTLHTMEALKLLQKEYKKHSSHALLLTAQHTTEEYESLVSFFIENIGQKNNIYYWQNNISSFNDFDGVLLRGDKNANTKGLLNVLNKKLGATYTTCTKEDLNKKLKENSIDMLWVVGPENQKVYPDLISQATDFDSYCQQVVWWTVHPLVTNKPLSNTWQIPLKTSFEKSGSFINYAGIVQKVSAVRVLVPQAVSLTEAVNILKGDKVEKTDKTTVIHKTNYWTQKRGTL